MKKKTIIIIIIAILLISLLGGVGLYFLFQDNSESVDTNSPKEEPSGTEQSSQSAKLDIDKSENTNSASSNYTNNPKNNDTSSNKNEIIPSDIDQGVLENGVRKNKNLYYTEIDGKKIYLDLYRPEKISRKLPVVVYIHGGGWQTGDKESGTGIEIARYGFAVASINYRLSNEAKFPAQIQDVKSAIRWLRKYSDKYGLDQNNIGVWGDSAGGHLAALAGTSGEVEEFKQGGNSDYSSQVQAACDWYGPTDFTQVDYEKYIDYKDAVTSLVGGLNNKSLMYKANPINYVDSNDPPFLIMHGEEDEVVPISQSKLLYESLQEVDVEVEYVAISNAGHGDGFEFGDHVLGRVVPFFEKHLNN